MTAEGPADADEFPEFAKLREDFPGWFYWRATNKAGDPTSWMATRVEPTAGVDRTLMSRTEAGMRVLLAQQKQAVEDGTGVVVATQPDAFWSPTAR